MKKTQSLFLTHLLFCSVVVAQEAKVKLMAFYNVENLFDTTRDTSSYAPMITYDKPGWDEKRYTIKITNLAKVIQHLGMRYGKHGPDLIGLAEVENHKVLNDLIEAEPLSPANYGIIHYNSPDHRGIDVALLFRPDSFIPHHSKTHTLRIYSSEGYRLRTRDLLVVSGYLEEELIHILVNHWPSRRGGRKESARNRADAARLNRRAIDSLERIYSNPYVVIMGDFNDDPTDPSIYHTLRGRNKAQDSLGILFNPMLSLFRRGYGSLAYRDRWHLFDQILLSGNSIKNEGRPVYFKEAGIFMPSWIKTSSGPYRGYPRRTYTGNTYTGGYSDHFPVYVVFYCTTNSSLIEPHIVRDSGKNQD